MQATDYAYTLQGWMKYINGPILHPEADMGNDGTDKNPTNFYFGRDVMAFGINYYGGDYKPIQNIPGNQFTNNFQLNSLPTGQPLYNGNISATLLALKGLNNNTTTGYTYLYDQLNRLLNTRQHVFGAASGSYKGNWSQSNTGTTDNYAETFRYDANGNILQLNRNGNSQHPGGLAMDRLNYTYRDGTNQLWSVQDGIAAWAYAGDIDNQGGSNYSYDRIGNLIGDVSENISQVNWTVYGKIGNIQKKQAFLGYVYNAGGERVVKQYLPYATNQCAECPPGTGIEDLEVYERYSAIPDTFKASKTVTFLSEYTEDERYREYSAIIDAELAQCTPQCAARPPLASSDADIYIRDATGNTLAVYHYDRKTSQLRWSEQHLYGSARLGMYLPEKSVTSVSTDSKQREVGYLGKQVFELSNHLGNILATITDKKLQVSLNTTSTAYFEADVQTVQNYYAFGMQMPGRKLSGGYRYGFNGKENDNEVKGEGNQQDYGMRIYDGRIGKFLSVDPLTKTFPWYTPYQFSGNSPIAKTDLDGGEPLDFKSKWKYQPLFDLKTGGKVKGTGTEIFVTDTKLGGGLRDVSLVYDEVTMQNWFVHQSGNKSYYLKNADGKNSVMTIDPKTYEVKGGEFVEFESQDQIESKAGAELANGIGKATYGIFSIGAALPAMTAIGGPLLATNSIFSSKFAIGAGADLSVQLARGEKTNFLSVGASGLFGNPFTASFTGSLFKDNKLEFNSGKDILLNTALGGLFGAGADKLGKGIHFSNPTPISNSVTEGIGKYLLNSGAGTATNATRDLITKPPNKSENENK